LIPDTGRDFVFATTCRLVLGSVHAVGTGDSFPGVNQAEREADQSPPSNVEINSTGRHTSIPLASSKSGAWVSSGTIASVVLWLVC
jgi:hypothetical protein